jgi:hypothetical protein
LASDRSVTGWASFLKPVMDRSRVAPHIVLLSPLLLITALGCASTANGRSRSAARLRFQQRVPRDPQIPSDVCRSERCPRGAPRKQGDRRVTRVRTRGADRRITSVFQCLIRIAFPLLGPRPHSTAAKGGRNLSMTGLSWPCCPPLLKPGICRLDANRLLARRNGHQRKNRAAGLRSHRPMIARLRSRYSAQESADAAQDPERLLNFPVMHRAIFALYPLRKRYRLPRAAERQLWATMRGVKPWTGLAS